jgi:hypothetical protein
MRQVEKACQVILPAGLKTRISRSRIYNLIEAKRLASTLKRLDLCSAQIAHIFHLSDLSGKMPLRDKTVLEIGSGWVLSHALAFYILGAKRVIATDILRLAYPSTLYQSLHCSEMSIIRDILAPFEEHSEIRARLNKLLTIKDFSFETLQGLGLEYIAPIDLALHPLNTKVDFIFSGSVLQVVPVSDVLALMKNLTADLSEGGKMIHTLHLEDTEDYENAPYDFLSEPVEKFTRDVQINRGNRIRRSQWSNILSQLEDMEFEFIYEYSRRDKELPEVIDPSIQYVDDEDLMISHIGILGTKKKS